MSELFPNAVQIQDLCYAKEKIHDLSKVIFGRGNDMTEPWTDPHIKMLRAGSVETFMKALLRGFESAHAEVPSAIGCSDRIRDRIRCREFLDRHQ